MENKKLKEISEKIMLLKADNERMNSFIKENRDNFKKWINEKFNNPVFDSNYVNVSDEVNEYKYTIESDDMLRLKKTPFQSFRRGWGHPMEFLFDSIEQKASEQTEYVYEGNYQPKIKERINIFEDLKEDMLNSGEICTTIKKYIYDDRKIRIEYQNQIDVNSSEIRKLEQENRKEMLAELNAHFTVEKLTELFKNKTTLVDGENCSLKIYDRNKVKSLTFKKETSDRYYLELVYENNEEDTIKCYKSDFDISNYIHFIN